MMKRQRGFIRISPPLQHLRRIYVSSDCIFFPIIHIQKTVLKSLFEHEKGSYLSFGYFETISTNPLSSMIGKRGNTMKFTVVKPVI